MERTLYDRATGQLLGHFVTSHVDGSGAGGRHGEVDGKFDVQTHYVDLTAEPPLAKEKQPLSLIANKTAIKADGADVARVTGVPIGAMLAIDDEEPIKVTDPEIDFAASAPGTYLLRLFGPAWLTAELEIVAT
ncbi:MAG: hypothetical protein WDN04_13270 [Rhodospirillales bacterium]